MNREQETAMYDQPDDDLVFLTYQPREGWTPDSRFGTPKKRDGRRFRVDVITQEIVPVTDDEIGYVLADRPLRFHSIVFTVMGVFSVSLIGVAGHVLRWWV